MSSIELVACTRNARLTSGQDLHPSVKELIKLVPEGDWKEFRMVGGPCLDHITGWGKIALIGDASHPLSGMIEADLSLLNTWLIARRCIWLRRSFCHGRWMDSCAGP